MPNDQKTETKTPTPEELRERFRVLEARLTQVPGLLRERGSWLRGTVQEDIPARAAHWAAEQLKRVHPELARVPALAPLAEAVEDGARRLDEASEALEKPPIEGYDEMNVHQVREALSGLDDWGREKVRRYEATHKARKTVLTEVTPHAA